MADFDGAKYKAFIEDNFDIIDKNKQVVPFILNPVQNEVIMSITGRDIYLKARQEGVSALVLAIMAVDFLMAPYSNSLTVAQEDFMVVKLFERVKFYLDSFVKRQKQRYGDSYELPLMYNNRKELKNADNGATFYVGSANSGDLGRSDTLTNVHFSEAAKYKNFKDIYKSASQAGTPKLIFIESTANGTGNLYHTMWTGAEEKSNGYRPHFFGWDKNPEYSLHMPEDEALTSEEQDLMVRFSLTKDQLMWRRQKMKEFDNENDFREEYPLTPHEAFVSSGSPVFNIRSLEWYETNKDAIVEPKAIGRLLGFKTPVLEENPRGYISIWKLPQKGEQYVIGADTSEGKPDGDFSCAQVINRKTFEQVAEWHGKVDPDLFGRELFKLGVYYNEAVIAPERNNHGIATIMSLRDTDYPNLWVRERIGEMTEKLMPEFGWVTDMKSKAEMIGYGQEFIRNKLGLIHSKMLLKELFDYHFDEKGHANAVPGSFDDRVIAFLIACVLCNRVPLEAESSNPIMQARDSGGDVNDLSMESSNDFAASEYF